MLVRLAESDIVKKTRAQAAWWTQTVVPEWSVGFPIQRESDNSVVERE